MRLCDSHCLQLSVGQPNSRVVALSQLKLASVFSILLSFIIMLLPAYYCHLCQLWLEILWLSWNHQGLTDWIKYFLQRRGVWHNFTQFQENLKRSSNIFSIKEQFNDSTSLFRLAAFIRAKHVTGHILKSKKIKQPITYVQCAHPPTRHQQGG